MLRSYYTGYDPKQSLRYLEDVVRSSLSSRGGDGSSTTGRYSPTERVAADTQTHSQSQPVMEATAFEHELLPADFDALSIEFKVPKEEKPVEPPKKYPAKLHARKVAKLLGAQDGLIYLPGAIETQWEDSDQGPPFRQRRYFYYLSGADFPGCAATYDVGADKLTLWIPHTPPATVLWLGTTPSVEECLARCDVHDVQHASGLPAYLVARLPRVRGPLYALRPDQLPDFDGFERMRPRLDVDVAALRPAMDEARLIKDDFEVAMIRRACEVSAEAHRAVAKALAGCVNECQIEASFLNSCVSQNAHAQAYPVIAGSGPNASTLHYGANNQALTGRELVVLDAGAEWSCYASDITRTLPLNRFSGGGWGRLSLRARAIYDLVLRMQAECVARVKPGVAFRDLQLHAARVAVEGLLDLGIFRRDAGFGADEIYAAGTAAAFFPHGLGHHIGLDCHDVLSRELLRPTGEGMWGKRRPVGPQTMRAMIRQAVAEEAVAEDSKQKQQEPKPEPKQAPRPPSSIPRRQRAPSSVSLSSPPRAPPQSSSSPATSSPSPSTTSTSPTTATATKPPTPAPSNKFGILQPGMVVTVEPGLYFCRPYIESYFLRAGGEHRRFFDLDVLDGYWDVGGVRIEDVLLVTPDGHDILSRDAPKYGVDEL